MALVLFKVGDTDYTNNIVMDSYDVQKNDMYVEWTDADWHDHQPMVRTRVEGSFTMKFRTLASYEAFVADLASKKETGRYYVGCRLWCNNTLTLETVGIYIDYAPVLTQRPSLQMDYLEFEVSVKEV